MAAINNPFDHTKASYLSIEEIQNLWVEYPSLRDITDPRSLQPKMIIGGKGSGKTHLLRYYSYSLQKIRHKQELVQGIVEEGYLGNYTLLSGLNADRFKGEKIDREIWNAIFYYYVDLFIVENLLRNLRDVTENTSVLEDKEELISKKICSTFEEEISLKKYSLTSVINFIKEERNKIAMEVVNSAITKKINHRIKCSPSNLVFRVPEIFKENIDEFKNLTFLYIIDELENITEWQQVYINSLIRECRPPSSIIVGSRLYGPKTYLTHSANEEIKVGAEFIEVFLDERFRHTSTDYKEFATELLLKRVWGDEPNNNQTNFSKNFETEDPFSAENSVFKKIIDKTKAKKKKVYFKKLRTEFKSLNNTKYTNKKVISYSDDQVETIIDSLTNDGKPLLEKLNCFLLYQSMSKSKNLVKTANEIKIDMQDFEAKKNNKYKRSFNKWKFDLIFQLVRDFELSLYNPVYTGFDAIIELSDGLPRNLLMIMNKLYSISPFIGENPVMNSFSVRAQNMAVEKASNWFYNDALPKGSDGVIMRECISKLANFFREFKYSDKPSEKTLISFSYVDSEISAEARKFIDMAEKWSQIIELDSGHKDRNSKKIRKKYRLNKMLCPRWELSISSGGTIQFSPEEIEVIFTNVRDHRYNIVMSRRLQKLNFPFNTIKKSTPDLFNDN